VDSIIFLVAVAIGLGLALWEQRRVRQLDKEQEEFDAIAGCTFVALGLVLKVRTARAAIQAKLDELKEHEQHDWHEARRLRKTLEDRLASLPTEEQIGQALVNQLKGIGVDGPIEIEVSHF
jgi:hypothetical protein